MKPIGLAKDQCCNWVNGVCCGGGFKFLDDGELHHFQLTSGQAPIEGGPCLVGLGQRCEFFEHNVLSSAGNPNEGPAILASRMSARRTYAARFPAAGLAAEERRCRCGRPLARRRRFCDSCRARRRRDTYRRRRAGQRAPAPQLSQNAVSQGAA